MKIFLSIITLSFLLSGNVYSELIKTEDLMKENYRCKNIINQNEWTFSFSKISNKDYHIKASNNSAGKLFAKLTTPNDLVWYQIIEPEGDGSLIMNVLNLRLKKEDLSNFMSVLIFFEADYTREDFKKLVDSYNLSEQAFYDQAANFVKTKLKFGEESYAKGNWTNLDRGICKSNHKSKIDTNQTSTEKFKDLQKKIESLNKDKKDKIKKIDRTKIIILKKE